MNPTPNPKAKTLFKLIKAEGDIDWEKVNQLVEQGADIHAINEEGHNLLSHFLEELWLNGANYIIAEASRNVEKEFDRQLAIVEKLIALGVKANHIVDDSTALVLVRFIYNYKLIEPLIEAGADPNRKSTEDGLNVIDDVDSDIFLAPEDSIYLPYYKKMLEVLEKG